LTTPPRPPGDQRITTPDLGWRQRAACQHADPELFFPVSASGPSLDQVTQTTAICAGCPVRRPCLAFRAAHQPGPRRMGRHERTRAPPTGNETPTRTWHPRSAATRRALPTATHTSHQGHQPRRRV